MEDLDLTSIVGYTRKRYRKPLEVHASGLGEIRKFKIIASNNINRMTKTEKSNWHL